jgi:hypothetical protein
MQFDVELYNDAGLSKSDISRLFGVSRTTVHNWHNGTTIHSLIQKRVKLISTAVRTALSKKKLPLDVSARSGDRATELSAVIKECL